MAGALLKKTGVVTIDQTPDAIDWANITAATQGANANQTISGIDGSITLGITYSDGIYGMEYRINSGTYTAILSGGTFSVSNGQTVNFRATWDGIDIVSGDVVTITNQSAAGTPTLDTFGVNLTG
jgi:hypothetical protein